MPRFRTIMRSLTLAFLAICALAIPAHAQVAVASQAGLDRNNQDLQEVWDRLRPALETQLLQMAQAELAAVHQPGNPEVSVKRAGPITVDLRGAPGFRALTSQRLEVAIPHSGVWSVGVEAEVRVKVKVLFARMTFDIPIKLHVGNIQAFVNATLDDSDPTRPLVQRLDTPIVGFDARLRSTRWYYDLLMRLFQPLGRRLAHRVVSDALGSLGGSLTGLSGLPGPVPGAGAAPLVDSGQPTPLLEVVGNVDRKMRQYHTPHGQVLESVMDVPAYTSWRDAYTNGGSGNPGTVVRYYDGGDSAFWTGHYLGSQALRYAVTADPDALDNVRHCVDGIGKLLAVNDDTGLLARTAAPENSLMGQEIAVRFTTYGRKVINGQTWVWRQGGNGISRDQYLGVVFGLTLAHDFSGDPAIRAECARLLQLIFDYIVGHDWYVDEDRRPFDATPGGSFPTFWAGIPYQKLTFMLTGERVAPGRYSAELAEVSPLASTAWLGAWVATFNLDSYYKFNLSHTTHYNYFRLETDPARWQDSMRAFAITRRYTGHHGNAHFDLVQASANPALQPANHSAVREALRQFIERCHRHVGPPVVDLSQVTWVTYTLPSLTLPGHSPQPQQQTLPSEPLPILIRKPEANFLWQRTPFEPAQASGGDVDRETPGTDLLLPYWMGRHEGAL